MTCARRVEFRDTDAAGIMHFSAYFTYMEEAEHELFRQLGTTVMQKVDEDTTISWPRVAAECQYRGSARFEDIIQIEVSVRRLGTSSVTFAFEFSVGDEPIATGTMTTVCCRFAKGQPPKSIPIDEPLRDRLSAMLVG
jgi:4-hydroxybenzoyl-CoA thioesterase/acyl-CoA thioester hydrolase